MILDPSVIALMSAALLVAAFAVYAAATGWRIEHRWDLSSGSELQLALERRTYLVSSVMSVLLVVELFSLLLFVYSADRMHLLFVGAMCAAGSLNVNAYGYPALTIKIVNSIACGVWLILNHLDNLGHDYPLIRSKYRLLAMIAGSLVLEAWLLSGYFLNIRPDVITSCCGTLFSEDAASVAGEFAALPPLATLVVFYLSVVVTLRAGVYCAVKGRAARLYALLSGWMLLVSLPAIISVISVYFYQLPTHHCPFCILQSDYGYVGYPLYLTLFTGVITGLGVGVVERYRHTASLAETAPAMRRRLCVTSMGSFAAFALIALYPMLFSDFRLIGY